MYVINPPTRSWSELLRALEARRILQASSVHLEASDLLPPITAVLAQAIVLDAFGPDSLDGDGPAPALLDLTLVEVHVDSEPVRVLRLRGSRGVSNAIEAAVLGGTWEELAEVALVEELTSAHGELWRREAEAQTREQMNHARESLTRLVASMRNEGQGYVCTGVFGDTCGEFPTTNCL
jgi:hypothetical protein